jgi:hypothetical protein
LWGAAWDLFYIQLIHEHNGIRKKDNNSFPQYILVTDDKPCSSIGNFAKVTSAFDYGDTIYNGVMMNADFPHLSHISGLLSEITLNMAIDMSQRAIARKSMSELNRQNEIEEIINRADSLILELTKHFNSVRRRDLVKSTNSFSQTSFWSKVVSVQRMKLKYMAIALPCTCSRAIACEMEVSLYKICR